MKNILIIGIVLLSGFLSSCEKKTSARIGFDSPIYPESAGLTILHAGHSIEFICLEGIVSMDEGETEIKLLNPQGLAVYCKRVKSPATLHVNEVIEAIPGFWKLQYKSDKGMGKIDLHLNYF